MADSKPSPQAVKRGTRLFHGGAPGLHPGDVIRPGMAASRYVDGCPDCEAHKAGHHGPLSGDPATPEEWVYASEDRQYARYYASRAVKGWLYSVELRGEVARSPEDPEQFGSWRAREAVVLAVYECSVRLTMKERRRLFIRWGGTEREFAEMVSAIASPSAATADTQPNPTHNENQ